MKEKRLKIFKFLRKEVCQKSNFHLTQILFLYYLFHNKRTLHWFIAKAMGSIDVTMTEIFPLQNFRNYFQLQILTIVLKI